MGPYMTRIYSLVILTCLRAVQDLQALQAMLIRQAHMQTIMRAAETGHAHDAHWRAASSLQNAPIWRLAVGGHLELLGEFWLCCSLPAASHGNMTFIRPVLSNAASEAAQHLAAADRVVPSGTSLILLLTACKLYTRTGMRFLLLL